MSTFKPIEAPIPLALRAPLSLLREALTGALAENLKSLVVYGGVARGEFTPGRSDVNLLIVLGSATAETLGAIRGPIQQARASFEPALMVLTPEDVGRAADHFPTKFLEIQRHHLLIAGQDLLKDAVIPRDRLLRQCVRELQNLLMRLRHFYLERAALPERLEKTVVDNLPGLMSNLATLLEVQTGKVFETRDQLVAAAAIQIGVPEKQLADLMAMKRDELRPDSDAIRVHYNHLMEITARAVHRASSGA